MDGEPSVVRRAYNLLRLLRDAVGHLPLAHKVSVALTLLIGTTLSILWFIVNTQLSALLNQQLDTFGTTIVKQTAGSAAELLLAEDLLGLNILVTQVAEAEDIVSATIADIDNQILAQSGDYPYSVKSNIIDQLPVHDPKIGVYIAPIVFQDVRAGYAYIAIDKVPIRSTIEQALRLMTLATILLLLFAMLIAIGLSRGITSPIKRLTLASYAIRKGQFEQEIPNRRYDEVGQLIDGFNEMARGLNERDKIRATFNRYFDPLVAKNILSHMDSPAPDSEYVNATVLFVDIVGFTKMCEEVPPDQMAKSLNTYYELILRASEHYGGAVDKYIGDGAMVLFGVPQKQPEHCFHAICCGLLILSLVEKVNQEREKQGEPVMQFKIGLHSGEMLAGFLGCEDRLQYTVVGDTVNVASRLCSQGPAKRVVISKAAYQQANGADRVATSDEFEWTVRGRAETIEVFLIESLSDSYQVALNGSVDEIYAQISKGIVDSDASVARVPKAEEAVLPD